MTHVLAVNDNFIHCETAMRLDTMSTLARIADDVYQSNDSNKRDMQISISRTYFESADTNTEGFQAAVYSRSDSENNYAVIAFRGTADAGGVGADAWIVMRSKPKQLDLALDFYDRVVDGMLPSNMTAENIIIVGHSLGGFLTQAVCTIKGNKGCAFNAPGARGLFSGRLLGRGKTFSNMGDSLRNADANIMNFTLANDPVSTRGGGKRIGKKLVINDRYVNAHGMGSLKKSIVESGFKNLTIEQVLALREAVSAPTSGY